MKTLLLLLFFSVTGYITIAQPTFQKLLLARNKIDRGQVWKVAGGNYMVASAIDHRNYSLLDVTLLDQEGNTKWNTIYTDSQHVFIKPCITQTEDFGFIVVSLSNLNRAIVLIKLNKKGKLEWSKELNGVPFWEVIATLNSADGNLFVIGRMKTGNNRAFILKLNPANGSVIWMKVLGIRLASSLDYYDTELFTGIALTKDGGFIICGIGAKRYDSPNADPLIAKYDKNGRYEWVKIINEQQDNNSSDFVSVTVAWDGGYIFVGNTRSATSVGLEDVCVVKLDKDGRRVWAKQIDNGYFESAQDVVKSYDSSYTVVGTKENQHSFLMRVNKNGSLDWYKTVVKTSDYDGIYNLSKTNDEGFITASPYNNSLLITKFDKDGNTCSGMRSESVGVQDMPIHFLNIVVDTADLTSGVHVSKGSFKQLNTKFYNTPFCQIQKTISENSFNNKKALDHLSLKLGASVFPNPLTGNSVSLRFQNVQGRDVLISIVNEMGKIVNVQKFAAISRNFSKTVSLDALPSGAYVVVVSSGVQNASVKFVKL